MNHPVPKTFQPSIPKGQIGPHNCAQRAANEVLIAGGSSKRSSSNCCYYRGFRKTVEKEILPKVHDKLALKLLVDGGWVIYALVIGSGHVLHNG